MNCFRIEFLSVFFVFVSLFVVGLVILCIVYFLFVVVSVPVQLIAWKDSSPKNDLLCRVGC